MTLSFSRLATLLRRAGRTTVLEPGQDSYAATTAGYQLGYANEPAAIVLAATAADIRDAVRVAADAGTPIAVAATGHGMPGDRRGGMLVDTRRMAAVTVDPAARTAHVQAGARWGDVIAAAAAHGLAPLAGSAPGVGAVGYTLEGGVGLLARRFGYAADLVRSAEIVTADGTLRTVSAQDDPELFWALRGGGGNFGIVTRMEIGLVAVERLYGGGLYFAGDDVPRVLAGWTGWTAQLPRELTSSIGLIPFPDRPGVPDPLRGRYVAHVRVAFLGGDRLDEEAQRLLTPLRALSTPVLDTLRTMNYAESERIYADPPTPMAYYATNVLVPDLTATDVATLVERTGPGTALPGVLQINHMGGALAAEPPTPGAVARRAQPYAVRVLSRLAPGAGDTVVPALRSDHDALYAALGVPDGDLVLNFLLGGPVSADQVRRGYRPADFAALRALKRRHDPDGVFSAYHPLPT